MVWQAYSLRCLDTSWCCVERKQIIQCRLEFLQARSVAQKHCQRMGTDFHFWGEISCPVLWADGFIMELYRELVMPYLRVIHHRAANRAPGSCHRWLAVASLIGAQQLVMTFLRDGKRPPIVSRAHAYHVAEKDRSAHSRQPTKGRSLSLLCFGY